MTRTTPSRRTILHFSQRFRTDACTFINLYLNRYVILPRVRSYGDSSTRTLSPGRIRIKFIRILPEAWASTRCPFANSTRNIALGKFSFTTPSTSIESFLAISCSATTSVDSGTVPTAKEGIVRYATSLRQSQHFRLAIGDGQRVLKMCG